MLGRKPGCMFRNGTCQFNMFNDSPDKCSLVDGQCYPIDKIPVKVKRPRESESNVSSNDPRSQPSNTSKRKFAFGTSPDSLKTQDLLAKVQSNPVISGPAGVSHIVYNEPGIDRNDSNGNSNVNDNDIINVYLFSDIHYSLDGTCPVPCKNLDGNRNHSGPENSNSNCSFIGRLLKDIFTYADTTNEYVDFYMEYPFQVTDALERKSIQEIQQLGYIANLYDIFDECFSKNKRNCSYVNTRFHYVDIRQFSRNGQPIVWNPFQSYVLLNRVERQFKLFLDKITVGYAQSHISTRKLDYELPEIELTNKLINYIYGNNGQVDFELFNMYIESNNFAEDFRRLIENSGIDPQSLRNDSSFSSYINDIEIALSTSNTNNRPHRLAQQFIELEADGRAELSRKIKNYTTSKFQNENSSNEILSLWNKFYYLYRSFIHKRQTGMSNLNKLKEDDIKRFKQILEIQGSINKVITEIVVSNSLLLDAYLLARMFRTFSAPKHGRSSITPSNTKIVYAGAAHIEVYRDFLVNVIGGREVHSSTTNLSSDYPRCVLSDLEKPEDYIHARQSGGSSGLFFNLN